LGEKEREAPAAANLLLSRAILAQMLLVAGACSFCWPDGPVPFVGRREPRPTAGLLAGVALPAAEVSGLPNCRDSTGVAQEADASRLSLVHWRPRKLRRASESTDLAGEAVTAVLVSACRLLSGPDDPGRPGLSGEAAGKSPGGAASRANPSTARAVKAMVPHEETSVVNARCWWLPSCVSRRLSVHSLCFPCKTQSSPNQSDTTAARTAHQ